MTNVAPLTVYTANERGKAQNCMYPNRMEITDEKSTVAAFSRDLVCAEYKNNYRSVQTFLWANALPMDCDNDHSDDPAKWITAEDLDSFFTGVTYLIHYSRHHMKPKGEKSARPRFHVIFLIDPTTDPVAYVQLKKRVAEAFPFFDPNAMDAARFLFGTEESQVLFHPGTITLNTFLDDYESERAFAELGNAMSGKSTSAIARQLTNEGIHTPGGKKVWQKATVDSILTNEKYKGAALLQKKYTVDFLTKTMKTNEGEVSQYYVEDSHPAIIKPAEWEAVQVEMERRRSKGRRHDCSSPFSGKIFCGDCSGVYGSKTWHSTDKYRRVIWQCNHKYNSGEKCGTPHLQEEDLKELFVQALGQYMNDPDERPEGLQYMQRAMTDTTFIDADLEETEQKLDLLSGMIRNCIMMNASATVGEREYQQQYAELTRQYEDLKAKYEELQDRQKQMNETAIIFGGMLFELRELDEIPVTFKESLWHTLVDYATVYADERIVFRFKDGTEVTTML